jgi:putative GTP pyrophosphokinase
VVRMNAPDRAAAYLTRLDLGARSDMKKKAKKKKAKSALTISQLEHEFKDVVPLATHFADELTRQIQELVTANSLPLSIPIQQRVKTWASLSEKLDRKEIRLKSVRDLDDLVGLRLILEFKRDASKVCELIEQNFKVLQNYDTSDRLKTDQFGYSSRHLVVELTDSWLAVPTLSQMKGWRAEIQVRTTAQHIWAAASHTLQYKHEESVPAPVRRAIHRVSALLETVDLEFERVLEQRDSYRSEAGQVPPEATLNVDLLESLLDTLLPEPNKYPGEEAYAELLSDLAHFKIVNRKGLTELVKKHLPAAMAVDRLFVDQSRAHPDEFSGQSSQSRQALGVYFTHTGLTRECLRKAFGENLVSSYLSKSD